ncbi:MAG: hypothetical protein ACFFAO_08545 [Candidatus Hermodarchaeota archaeon]
MRRILKAIASGTEIGNVTMLAGPSVVDDLIEERKKMDVEIGKIMFLFIFSLK